MTKSVNGGCEWTEGANQWKQPGKELKVGL